MTGWIRWFPGDVRGSMRYADLSLAERGLYRDLLDLQAIHAGPFEYDAARLSRQVRCDRSEMEDLWPKIQHLFEQAPDGRWFNAKMQAEVDRSTDQSEQARKAGRASAEARARQRALERCAATDVATDVGTPVPTGRATECPTTPTPTPTPIQTQTQKKNTPPTPRKRGGAARKQAALDDRPVGIPQDAWEEWVEHLWGLPRKPSDGALAKHRAVLEQGALERGLPAVRSYLSERISNNAGGFPSWSVDQLMDPSRAPRRAVPTNPYTEALREHDGQQTASGDRDAGDVHGGLWPALNGPSEGGGGVDHGPALADGRADP